MDLEKEGKGSQGWKTGLPVKEPAPNEALVCPFAAEHRTISCGNLEDEDRALQSPFSPKEPPQLTPSYQNAPRGQ